MIEDLDEEAKAKRRKEQIEFRNKKRFSGMFMFFASVFEIIETLALIILLFLGFAAILFKIFPADSEVAGTIYSIGTIIIFIGGMVLGFFIYKKTVQFVIEKFKLEEKLSDEILSHYKKHSKEELEKELKR